MNVTLYRSMKRLTAVNKGTKYPETQGYNLSSGRRGQVQQGYSYIFQFGPDWFDLELVTAHYGHYVHNVCLECSTIL